ncbi:MAG: helical backbone metal receptor [Thermoanaerobaculia bacterium]
MPFSKALPIRRHRLGTAASFSRSGFLRLAGSLASLLLILLACGSPAPPIEHHSRPAGRIITLAPNLTEIVYALGCGERVIAADDFSNYPPEVRSLPKVGGLEPNAEKIISLRPDLLLASTSADYSGLASQLRRAGIPLVLVRTDRLDDVPPAIEQLSAAMRCGDGPRVANQLRRALASVAQSRPDPPRVLFVASTDPLFVAGGGTFVDDLIRLTGGRNAAADIHGWAQYSQEVLLSAPPDLVLFPGRSVSGSRIRRMLPKGRREGGVIAVDEDLFSRPGPRVAAAAKELARIEDRWEGGR